MPGHRDPHTEYSAQAQKVNTLRTMVDILCPSRIFISVATPTDPRMLDSKRYAELWPEGHDFPLDSVDANRRILHVANTSLSRQTQREAFQLWMRGLTTTQIAKALERDTESVHRTLYGSPSRKLKGVVEMVKEALQQDETFTAMAKKKPEPVDPIGRHAIATWFAGAPPDRFVEMAALLVFAALADSEGWLTVQDAYGAMSPQIVTHSLPRLRWGGYIHTDGIRIRVLKTPGGASA